MVRQQYKEQVINLYHFFFFFFFGSHQRTGFLVSPLSKQVYKYFQRCSCVSNIVIKDNIHFNMYNIEIYIIISGRYGAYKDIYTLLRVRV